MVQRSRRIYPLIYICVMVTIEFIRDYYGIPKRYKLGWAIMVEREGDKKVSRLCVELKGTDKVIDVMARKFIQTGNILLTSRKVYPARKKLSGNTITFSAVKGNEVICFGKEDLEEEYFVSRFSEKLMNTFLL